MPRPTEMLRDALRRVRFVARYPNSVQRGVCLADGSDNHPQTSYFEVIDRDDRRLGGPWVKLENMELHVIAEFRLEDCGPLRIVGNAQRVRERMGWQ